VNRKASFLIFILVFVLNSRAFATDFEYVADSVLPASEKFVKKNMKSQFGGISGVVWSSEKNRLIAVSDDRGNINEPRFYELDVKLDKSAKLSLTVKDVHFLRPAKNNHEDPPKGSWPRGKVLDFEGIAFSPWGDLLIVSEGDANKKPRQPAQLMNFKTNGAFVRDFDMPLDFVPVKTGLQKKGCRNNRAFEGLAISPSGKRIIVSTESPLLQDPPNKVRFIEYEMKEPFVLKPKKQYFYPLNLSTEKDKGSDLDAGVSEVLFVDENKLLVLERSVQLTLNGPEFKIELYQVELKDPSKHEEIISLEKKLIFNLSKFQNQLKAHQSIENFEAMAWMDINGKRSLLLASDNNFFKSTPTHFILLKEKP
jgi:hypothetical protein